VGKMRAHAPRDIAAGADLLRSTGARQGWARLRHGRRWAAVRANARAELSREIWNDAASEVGASVHDLPGSDFEIEHGGRILEFRRGRPPVDESWNWAIANDKHGQRTVLRRAGIATPDTLMFDVGELRTAIEFLEAAGGPCVVKPAADSGAGNGVTSGVTSRGDLVRAALRAARSGPSLLIEREAEGDEYRVLVLDREVIDVVRRGRPSLVGDGHSTVAELIDVENARRLAGGPIERLHLLTTDLDLVLALRRQGLSLRSRPDAGRRFTVKGVVNQNAPAENETVHDELSDDARTFLRGIVRSAGLRLGGIDLITNDLRELPAAAAVVLEVNPHPGLHHHYAVADPKRATRVAVPILRALVADRRCARLRLSPLADPKVAAEPLA